MNKLTLMKVFFPIIVVALLAVILIPLLSKPAKTPATAEQVCVALEDNDFPFADTTEDYLRDWKVDYSLKQAISTEKDDIRFDFFVFDSDKNAEKVRAQYQSYTRTNRYAYPNIEIKEGIKNYTLYTIKANGVYTVNMRVDNTLVYAYCDEENATEINNIMVDIGYFNE